MVIEKITKGAKTFILVVMIAAIAAGILTLLIWTQPDFIAMMIAQGNYWLIFSTFLTCWMLATIIAYILLMCATHKPQSVSGTLAE